MINNISTFILEQVYLCVGEGGGVKCCYAGDLIREFLKLHKKIECVLTSLSQPLGVWPPHGLSSPCMNVIGTSRPHPSCSPSPSSNCSRTPLALA